MENEKPSTGRESRRFESNNDIKNCFSTIYNNCPKTYCKQTSKNTRGFFSIPTIKHENLCNGYKAGRLRNVDIPNKIIALQSSWSRRFYDNSFHEWKFICYI